MNRDTASLILTSLRERAENSSGPVVLTSVEIRALQVLFGETSALPEPGPSQSEINAQDKGKHRELSGQDLRWESEEGPDDNLLLCLDFGTSFSKASACQLGDYHNDFELIDISFGENDDGTKRFFLPSELFIHDDHVYFGTSARRMFEAVEAPQERLIDGPKQYITLGTDVSDLHHKPLRKEQDPSESLSKRDALVLYLSHLNYLAEKSLKDSSFTTNVRRRYTHPGWDEETKGANSEAMKRIMAESIALAKCYSDEFDEGMPLQMARDIARAVQKMDATDLPFELLDNAVLEATAAGAGALMSTTERKREVYVILDVGAGTTDVAGCVCVNNPDNDRVIVAEITSATKAIRRAGNNIDHILLQEILERNTSADRTSEQDQIIQAVRKRIREYKESLFDDGFLTVQLPSDEVVEIGLEEFLENASVKSLFSEIRTIVTNAAFQVVGDDLQVFLVATGGGAKLPAVQELVSNPVKKNGHKLRLSSRPAMPTDLRDIYPQLIDVYPQMAVAVGGAHPELPKQITSINEGIHDPGPKVLSPIYRS